MTAHAAAPTPSFFTVAVLLSAGADFGLGIRIANFHTQYKTEISPSQGVIEWSSREQPFDAMLDANLQAALRLGRRVSILASGGIIVSGLPMFAPDRSDWLYNRDDLRDSALGPNGGIWDPQELEALLLRYKISGGIITYTGRLGFSVTY